MRTRPFDPSANPGRLQQWSATVTNLAEFAAVATVNLLTPSLLSWVNYTTGETEVWRLLPGFDETGEGVQRPDDYDALSNAKVWYRSST